MKKGKFSPQDCITEERNSDIFNSGSETILSTQNKITIKKCILNDVAWLKAIRIFQNGDLGDKQRDIEEDKSNIDNINIY